jgi:hypothetical protein
MIFKKSIDIEQIIILFSSLIFFVLLIIKANLTPITYDEAYTFLKYAITKDFFSISLANNHFLNSIFIYIATFYSEDVFFIRLPNLLFGLIYIYIYQYWYLKKQIFLFFLSLRLTPAHIYLNFFL